MFLQKLKLQQAIQAKRFGNKATETTDKTRTSVQNNICCNYQDGHQKCLKIWNIFQTAL